MRHALVTGGAGFIGSHLVDTLLGEGWRITVVDNFDPFYDPELKRKNVAPHLGHSAFTLIEADIRDLEFLRESLSGDYDVIIHLAAKAGVRPSIQDPIAYGQVNVVGTRNLLELAKEWGVRQFVYASSSSVYGVNPKVPWREDDSVLLPISPYACTKASGELIGHVYSHLYGIRFIALRLFTVYGPRQRPDLAIHKFAQRMLRGEVIPIYGDGSACRDLTYVADVIKGVTAAIEYDGGPYEVFNLGSGCPVSVIEIVRTLETVLAIKPQIVFFPPQPGDVPQTWADLCKAARLLGYRPNMDLESGVAEFARWLHNSG